MQKLEALGFYISPAMRLRLLKILDTVWQEGRKIEDLKFLIAPVIAQSPNEQTKFYELFDRYLIEIKEPIDFEPLPKWYEQIPRWVYYLIGLLFLVYLVFTVKSVFDRIIPSPEISFILPDTVRVNEFFTLTNTSQNCDTLNTLFEWQIWDEKETTLEYSDTSNYDLAYQFQSVGQDFQKIAKLISLDRISGQRDTFIAPLIAHCAGFPEIELILPKSQYTAFEKLDAAVQPKLAAEEYELEWIFGDEIGNHPERFTPLLKKPGSFSFSLGVKRKNADGFCETIISEKFSVGDNNPVLATLSLKRDSVKTKAQFSSLFWVLWSMSLLAMLFFLIRWLRRKPPSPESENAKKEKPPSPDRGPYFIPFRNRNGSITVERELFRFANVLRQRQEGNRKKINIQETLTSTIDGGGFPRLVMSSQSRPTEYLFLIEEHSEHSHLTNLFKYISTFLEEKEVLIESYSYNQSFKSFWNKEHPKGLSLDLLRRFYPNHRVVILGDGHHFLDRHSKDKPRLQRNLANLFRQWKQRILITSMPLESWTYKEKVLYNLFTIFPADLDGLHDAMAFLEAGLEAEDASTFNLWMEQFEDNAPAPNVNFFRWRKVDDHREYLKNHPKLMQWLTAIAVYPKPNWNLTITIGKALEPIGVEVNYENLLILSRIEWLKSGNLNPRLRRDLLKKIDYQTEKLARQAVQDELAAVKKLTENSAAGRALNINKSLNDFALNPEKSNYQRTLRDLMEMGLLTKKHLVELNQDLERHFNPNNGETSNIDEPKSKSSRKGLFSNVSNTPVAPTINEFLSQNKEEEEPPKRPFFTRDFWITGLAGLLFLLFSLAYWQLNETEFLHRIAFNESPQPVFETERDSLKTNVIAKQDFEMDSSVFYNNRGVKRWEQFQNNSLDISFANRNQVPSFSDTIDFIYNSINDDFEKSLEFNANYGIVDTNQTQFHHNLGSAFFNKFQQSSEDSFLLNQAKIYFHQSFSKNENHWDALHGIGLIHHIQSTDSVCTVVDKLLEASTQGADLNFNHPNLLTIAEYCKPNSISIIIEGATDFALIETLKKTLQKSAYYILPIEKSNGDHLNSIKYYNLEDEKLARNIGSQIIDFLKENNIRLNKKELLIEHISNTPQKNAEIEITLNLPKSKKTPEKIPSKPKISTEQKTPQTENITLSDFQWLDGKWAASVYNNLQSNSPNYEAHFRINTSNNSFQVYYPKLGCRSQLSPRDFTDKNKLTLTERFVGGTNCPTGYQIKIEKTEKSEDISIKYRAGKREISGSTLEKKDFFDLTDFTWLDGLWEASVYQANAKSKKNWIAEIDLDTKKSSFKISYPEFPCSGNWKVEKLERNRVWFRENLSVNNDCLKNIPVSIEKVGSKLRVRFYDEKGTREDGNAFLTKQKVIPTIFGNPKSGYGLMNVQTNDIILKETYENIEPFGRIFKDQSLAEVQSNGYHGIINMEGKVIVPLVYQDLMGVEVNDKAVYNVAIIRKNGLEGVINNLGEILIEAQFESINIKSETEFIGRQNGEDIVLNRKGEVVEAEKDVAFYERKFGEIYDKVENLIIDLGRNTKSRPSKLKGGYSNIEKLKQLREIKASIEVHYNIKSKRVRKGISLAILEKNLEEIESKLIAISN